MREEAIYAVYRGENILCMGTAEECAKVLNVKPDTIEWYTYPTYQRRLSKRKNPEKCRIVIKIDDDEEDFE